MTDHTTRFLGTIAIYTHHIVGVHCNIDMSIQQRRFGSAKPFEAEVMSVVIVVPHTDHPRKQRTVVILNIHQERLGPVFFVVDNQRCDDHRFGRSQLGFRSVVIAVYHKEVVYTVPFRSDPGKSGSGMDKVFHAVCRREETPQHPLFSHTLQFSMVVFGAQRPYGAYEQIVLDGKLFPKRYAYGGQRGCYDGRHCTMGGEESFRILVHFLVG
jgi:hypothetical protein